MAKRMYTKKKKTEKKVYERWVVKNVNPNRDYFVNYPQSDIGVIQHIPFWLEGEYTIKWDGNCTDDMMKAEWYLKEEDAQWGANVLMKEIVEGKMFAKGVEGSLYRDYANLITTKEYAKYAPEYKAVKVKITIEEE